MDRGRREHWKRAGVDDRIDLRIGPALDTLRALPADQAIDLAFIDADKTSYRTYYEEILARLRPGGLVLVDNVLWGGKVVDESDPSDDTVAIRAFNDHVAARRARRGRHAPDRRRPDDRPQALKSAPRDGVAQLHRARYVSGVATQGERRAETRQRLLDGSRSCSPSAGSRARRWTPSPSEPSAPPARSTTTSAARTVCSTRCWRGGSTMSPP